MNWSLRSDEKEWLEERDFPIQKVSRNMSEIAMLNQLLGSENKFLGEIARDLRRQIENRKPIRVIDLGCGNGSLLAALQRRLNAEEQQLIEWIGVDLNAQVLARPQTQTPIEWVNSDVLVYLSKLNKQKQNVYLASLFFHHCDDIAIVEILKHVVDSDNILYVSDLKRSQLAHFLFLLFSNISFLSSLSRHDGLVSIRRGFTIEDWRGILRKAGVKNYSLKTRWAFRHHLKIEP